MSDNWEEAKRRVNSRTRKEEPKFTSPPKQYRLSPEDRQRLNAPITTIHGRLAGDDPAGVPDMLRLRRAAPKRSKRTVAPCFSRKLASKSWRNRRRPKR